ncbi:hypothetical protein TTHERM_00143839 (macronuclear) [Tetrahymena thermophila SB210]|uniref:EGF-like domain-containing protein n=1 Tax=Tetrahymena thermophila (strain SB210) TaxID=312017 RepID=A4VED4_TETTS|nr:hypothetical protein TTHERM_00143839 [Tetrahymena thermophila SB210]EDK31890.2 hypothetical protein TTHERM_00143839 [Tetrahymena thermophila SB210]|eukprot:XP_001470748.2 hypothetical protein TTHERM_00143839 [Tetrahymena thermophila SB210]
MINYCLLLAFIILYQISSSFQLSPSPGPIKIKFQPATPATTIPQTQQDIVNSAIIFFQNLLIMNQQAANYDVLININNSDTTKCVNQMPFTITGASTLPFDGTIYFCNLANAQLNNNFTFKKMVDSVIHGIMKIITFSSAFKIKPSSCTTNCYADDSAYINLQSLFKQIYNKSTFANMPMASYTTPSSYYLWSKQYAYDDLMTDNYSTENKFWSAFNNQILKDIKDSSNNPLFYSVNDQMKQQIITPLLGSDNCQQSNELFCTSSQQNLSCNASLTAKSSCQSIDQTSNSCMVYQTITQGNCLDPQLNKDLAGLISTSGTYEYYGYDSRCFLSDIQDISATVYIQPVRCYKYSCDDSNNVYIYLDQSTNGNQPNIDIVTCTVQMQGSQQLFSNQKYYSKTGITCPKNNANFCQGMPKQCKNYCSSKGVCVNGKCKCVQNYYGDDCSCFQLSQENGKCVQSCSKKMKQANDGSQICVPLCQDGQFFQTATGQCQKCDQNCKTCWEKSSKCDSCDTANGFILFTDNTCKQSYPNQKCQINQYYDGAKCSPCSTSCQSCAINSTFCTSCLSNQFLQNGTCQNCPSNCLACSGIQLCTQCAPNFYLNQLLNECISSCSTGLFAYNSTCVQTCPSGYFGNTTNNTCQQCDPTCLTCTQSSTQCTSCAYYRQLQGTQCVDFCPSNQVWVRKQPGGSNWSFECIACSLQQKCNQCLGSPTYCTDCLPSFYLLDSDCLTVCTSSYYADESQRKCIKCDASCLTCQNSSKNCTSCPQGFYLKGGQCVSSCGSGFVPNNDTQNCDASNKTSDQNSSSSSSSQQSSSRLQLNLLMLLMFTFMLLTVY